MTVAKTVAKIIFFQAHPDDLEMNCAYLIHYLKKQSPKKHEIRIASTTKGEFGLPGTQYDKFKGEFLANVRTRELCAAVAVHGIPAAHVDWLGYIDGFVKFTRPFVDHIASYLRKHRPDIIVAPEPLYTWYYHRDHTNTGAAIFYAIHHHLIDYTPILYYYTSINSNYYFPVDDKKMQLTKQLVACHKTQFWLLNWITIFAKILGRIYGFKNKRYRFKFTHAEPYRRVFFNPENRRRNRAKFFPRIMTHFFYSLPFYRAQYPEAMLPKIEAMMRKQRGLDG